MPEYGNAFAMRQPHELMDDAALAAVQNMLTHNFRTVKEQHPEWNLPDEYEVVVGPIVEAYQYEDCSECRGEGCVFCDQQGMVPIGPFDPPQWIHQFGWRVTVE